MYASFFIHLWENIQFIGSQLTLLSLLDFFLVWAVIYRILLLTQRSGAVQILMGLGILGIAYLLSIHLELVTLNWLLEKIFSNLFLIIVILFQAEIRSALAQIGSNPLFYDIPKSEETQIVEEMAMGALKLAQRGLGALIVIEKEIALDYFIEMGTELNADISAELLHALFLPESPLHDGAVILRGGRVWAAGCFLPLSKNPVLDKNLGTRHRAALGLTEETDALVLVVSEEHKSVNVVQNGQLIPDLDHSGVRKYLYDFCEIKQKNS